MATAALVVLAATGCGQAAGREPKQTTLRLGYFPNLTHATAIVGVESGLFRQSLGSDKLAVSTFNAGPQAIEALFAGALDAAYIGPTPAINAYLRSHGHAVKIVSGATSGGAMLVVRPGIDDAAGLRGKRVASPQLGQTQDVALRYWLRQHGLKTDPQGGGDVSVVPQENAQTLETFRSGLIDGAWVPEPWATRLVREAGGRVLVDERTLWPEGRFVTTHLIVRTRFLEQHRDIVGRLVEGQVRANELVNADPTAAQRMVNRGITRLTGKSLPEPVLREAWGSMQFTNDPVTASLQATAAHAREVGLLDPVDLRGIYDLTLLNQAVAAIARPVPES